MKSILVFDSTAEMLDKFADRHDLSTGDVAEIIETLLEEHLLEVIADAKEIEK